MASHTGCEYEQVRVALQMCVHGYTVTFLSVHPNCLCENEHKQIKCRNVHTHVDTKAKLISMYKDITSSTYVHMCTMPFVCQTCHIP